MLSSPTLPNCSRLLSVVLQVRYFPVPVKGIASKPGGNISSRFRSIGDGSHKRGQNRGAHRLAGWVKTNPYYSPVSPAIHPSIYADDEVVSISTALGGVILQQGMYAPAIRIMR